MRTGAFWGIRGAVCLLASAVTGCCPNAYLLGDYNNPGSPAYICRVPSSTQYGSCGLYTTTNEADWQKSGIVHLPLPANLFSECRDGVQRLLVRGDNTILYECANPKITVGTAGPTAAAPSNPTPKGASAKP